MKNHCRLKSNKGYLATRPYFHLNYVLFPGATNVLSFPAKLSEEESQTIETVLSKWGNIDERLNDTGLSLKGLPKVLLNLGRRRLLFNMQLGGLLDHLRMQPIWPEDITETARARSLRELVLKFYWNGQEEPSVNVPFGDFFCNAFYPAVFDLWH